MVELYGDHQQISVGLFVKAVSVWSAKKELRTKRDERRKSQKPEFSISIS